MTAKEKARELVDKMNSANKHLNYSRAKTIALIFVDEIIKELKSTQFNYDLDLEDDVIRYWNEVKQEINKL
tara:strand:+ start:1236 stop:1448 length:213 start_codon:yes stop_codon:yes gene_type:complete